MPNKFFSVKRQFINYFLVTSGLLISVFLGIFPDAFIEGLGLTNFKIYSEYVICVILALSLIVYIKNRYDNLNNADTFIIVSIAMTIISELFFTTYVSVFGFSNLVGHAFKIISFYFLYIALVKTSIREPHYTLDKLNRFFNEKIEL